MGAPLTWAHISFPKKYLEDPAVREALEEEFCWGQSLEEVMEDDDTFSEQNGVVTFMANEVSYGKFEDLEQLLREKKIPYDRSNGDEVDTPAGTVMYRPDVREKPFWVAGEDCRMVNAEALLEARKKGPEEVLKLVDEMLAEAFADKTYPLAKYN